MGFIYTNPFETDPPQVIKSETELEHLEGDARWVRTEGSTRQTAAEKKAEADAAAATAKAAADKAEADRIDGLPFHVGDTVKLNAETLKLAGEQKDATPAGIEKATAWRGTITEVRHDADSDADIAEFDGKAPAVPLDSLELVTE